MAWASTSTGERSSTPERRGGDLSVSAPLGSTAEGGHLGFGCFLFDLGLREGFVGLPVFAGELRISVDGGFCCGEEGVSPYRHVGWEFAGALRLAFEADRGSSLLAAVRGAGCRRASLADLVGVEPAGADRGADERADDALEVHL